MNSSTSNSKKHSLLFTLVGVIALLAGLELITRWVLYPKSLDYAQFALFPDKVRSLKDRPSLGLALLGNSALAEGVDTTQLSASLEADHRANRAHAFPADSSEIITWRAMANDLFWRTQTRPDVMVVFFFGNRLEDQAVVQKGRLAQFFTEPADWPEIFSTDLKDTSARIEFVVSSFWATYAARERIRQRVFDYVVPNFRDFERQLNQLNHSYDAPPPTKPTYRVLHRFLEQTKAQQVKVIMVRFPVLTPSDVDPEIQELFKTYQCGYVDMQSFAERNATHYKDGIHLKPEGRRLYTQELAQALAPLLVHQP